MSKDFPSYPTKRKRRKWPVILIGFFALIVLAYPIAGNFLLYSGMLEQIISKKPEKLNLTWDSAWTLWPGKIHVEGFHLDIHSKKNRIQVQIEKAALQLNLLPLIDKNIQITSVDAEGLKVSHVKRAKKPETEVADKGEPEAASTGETEVAGNGEIQAADKDKPADTIEKPVIEMTEVSAKTDSPSDNPPKKKKKPWVIDITGARAKRLELVEFNKLKLAGEGVLEELALHLVTKGGPLRLDALKLDMNVDTTADPDDFDVRYARISADLKIAENIPKQNKGKKLLKFFSGRVEFSGDANGIKFLSALLGDKYELSVAGGGILHMLAIVESGELMDGSRINFSSESFETFFLNLQASGNGEITGKVDASNSENPANFNILVKGFRLNRVNLPNPYMEGADLTVELKARKIFLHKDMEGGELFVHFPDSHVRDLTDYNRFLPKHSNLKILGGEGRLRGTMDLKEDTGYVNMELDGTGIDLDINGAEIRTDLKMVTNLTDGNYGEKSYDLSGTSLRLDNARVSKQEAVAKDHWWGEVKVTKGDLIWTEPMDVDAEMEIKMRDTEPLITLLGNAKKKKSLIDKALTIKDVTGTVGIQTNEKDIVLDPIQVEGDGLQVISRLDLLEESMNGVLYFKLHGIAANFEIKDGKAKFKGLGGKNKVKKKVNLKDSDSAHKPNPHDHKAISKNLQ